MMMVVGFGVQAAAFAALNDNAVDIPVGNIDHQLGLAGAATMGLVAATLAHGLAGGMLKDLGAFGLLRGKEDHVELGHGRAFLKPETLIDILSTTGKGFSMPQNRLLKRCPTRPPHS